MNGEGDQIERDEHRRQVVFSVAEVVFEIVAFCFQSVESFVLDFPPRPAGGGEIFDIAGVDFEIGNEAVAIGDLAAGIADGDFQPIGFERVLAVARRLIPLTQVMVTVCPADATVSTDGRGNLPSAKSLDVPMAPYGGRKLAIASEKAGKSNLCQRDKPRRE